METIDLPVLGYRIGIVGNRDLTGADIGKIKERLAWLLNRLCKGVETIRVEHGARSSKPLYADEASRFHLINSLAEGADQLAAAVVHDLDRDFRLYCPIPFPLAVYKRHFAGDAGRQGLNALLADASFDATLIELDCCADTPRHRQEGYRAAADMLLENADILIALFDPDQDGDIGGSIETVRFAVQKHLPVIHLDTRNPDRITLLGKPGHFELEGEPVTDQVIDRLLAEALLPAPAMGEKRGSEQEHAKRQAEAVRQAQAFFDDPLIRRSGVKHLLMLFAHGAYAWVWKLLFAMLKIREGSVAPAGQCGEPGTGPDADTSVREKFAALQQPFRRRMERIDRAAMEYMNAYRGSFILNFLFGALAVLLAVLSYFSGGTLTLLVWEYKAKTVFAVAELVCVTAIFLTYLYARLGDWQKRAVDLRFLAECLRHVEVLVLLGRNTRLLQPVPRHHAHHDPARTWMGWYFNAFMRSLGPFCGLRPEATETGPAIVRMDAAYVHQVQHQMCAVWLEDQYAYHKRQAKRFARWEIGATVFMSFLFVLIVSGVATHLLHRHWPHPAGWHEDVLIALTVTALPALLAAIHGITVQGEFRRLAERSEGTAGYLSQHIKLFSKIKPEPQSHYADAVGDYAVEAASAMLEEVTDWQVLYRGHAVELT